MRDTESASTSQVTARALSQAHGSTRRRATSPRGCMSARPQPMSMFRATHRARARDQARRGFRPRSGHALQPATSLFRRATGRASTTVTALPAAASGRSRSLPITLSTRTRRRDPEPPQILPQALQPASRCAATLPAAAGARRRQRRRSWRRATRSRSTPTCLSRRSAMTPRGGCCRTAGSRPGRCRSWHGRATARRPTAASSAVTRAASPPGSSASGPMRLRRTLPAPSVAARAAMAILPTRRTPAAPGRAAPARLLVPSRALRLRLAGCTAGGRVPFRIPMRGSHQRAPSADGTATDLRLPNRTLAGLADLGLWTGGTARWASRALRSSRLWTRPRCPPPQPAFPATSPAAARIPAPLPRLLCSRRPALAAAPSHPLAPAALPVRLQIRRWSLPAHLQTRGRAQMEAWAEEALQTSRQWLVLPPGQMVCTPMVLLPLPMVEHQTGWTRPKSAQTRVTRLPLGWTRRQGTPSSGQGPRPSASPLWTMMPQRPHRTAQTMRRMACGCQVAQNQSTKLLAVSVLLVASRQRSQRTRLIRASSKQLSSQRLSQREPQALLVRRLFAGLHEWSSMLLVRCFLIIQQPHPLLILMACSHVLLVYVPIMSSHMIPWSAALIVSRAASIPGTEGEPGGAPATALNRAQQTGDTEASTATNVQQDRRGAKGRSLQRTVSKSILRKSSVVSIQREAVKGYLVHRCLSRLHCSRLLKKCTRRPVSLETPITVLFTSCTCVLSC